MITEFLKNLGGDLTVWAGVALFFFQRYVKREESGLEALTKTVEDNKKNHDKLDEKVDRLNDLVVELNTKLKR